MGGPPKGSGARPTLKGWFSKRVVWADVPPERKPEQGYIRMFPWNEKNRNEGTFTHSPGTKTGTSEYLPKPPFYETALLSPGEVVGREMCFCRAILQWAFSPKSLPDVARTPRKLDILFWINLLLAIQACLGVGGFSRPKSDGVRGCNGLHRRKHHHQPQAQAGRIGHLPSGRQ